MRLKPALLLGTLCSTFLSTSLSTQALAWGERGHHIVSRAAARKIELTQERKLSTPFIQKAFMLGHLANIPDTAWKQLAGDKTTLGNSTHYISLEAFSDKLDFSAINHCPLKAHQDVVTRCQKDPKPCRDLKLGVDSVLYEVGSAPWRIEQFLRLMASEFKKVPTSKNPNATANLALTYGGLAAHYIGDLANPHHTTFDHGGWEIGMGGAHFFFESAVVSALPFDLEEKVLQKVLKDNPVQDLLSKIPKHNVKKRPFLASVALAFDSYQKLPDLIYLDKTYAVKEPSDKKTHRSAVRALPKDVAKFFEPLIVERLALASDLMAHLWMWAWDQGGAPDLSWFFTHEYRHAPDFIPPDYFAIDEDEVEEEVMEEKV